MSDSTTIPSPEALGSDIIWLWRQEESRQPFVMHWVEHLKCWEGYALRMIPGDTLPSWYDYCAGDRRTWLPTASGTVMTDLYGYPDWFVDHFTETMGISNR